jgi:hypothetical protein
LYAPEFLSCIQNEVITFALAPGLGDAETQAGGLEHEVHLGQLSPLFVGAFLWLTLFVPPGALPGRNFRAVFHGPN